MNNDIIVLYFGEPLNRNNRIISRNNEEFIFLNATSTGNLIVSDKSLTRTLVLESYKFPGVDVLPVEHIDIKPVEYYKEQ